MSTFADMQAAVDRGARFCDLVRPDWVNEINLELFDFSSSWDCVAGTLFNYLDIERNQGRVFMQANGFDVPNGSLVWSMPTQPEDGCECCSDGELNAYDVMHEMWAYKIRKAQSL